MNKEQISFKTIEDMVKFVIERPHAADLRYKLEYRMDWEYVDKKAGAKWTDERYSIPYAHGDEESIKERSRKIKELESRQPEQIRIAEWSLCCSTSSWSSVSINLSAELGETLDGIWTRKDRGRFSERIERVGLLSITGMLKRLGKTDIGEQIAKAKKEAEAEQQKRTRNNIRANVRQQAQMLIDYMIAHQDKVGFPVDLSELANLQDE